jgi:opacity protein-like surface antigen
MSLRKLLLAASLIGLVSAVAPSRASADWLFTPFLGETFGGSADVAGKGADFKSDFQHKLNYGASLAFIGNGAFGVEVDLGYSPNFFRDDGGSAFAGDGNVTTLMGNLVIGAPHGPVRPYASGGVGLLKSKVDSVGQFFGKVDSNDFGYDLGGGVMGFFSSRVGLRGDIRYFRSLQNNDPNGVDLSLGSFRFWRGTVGVTFQF